MNSGTLTLTSFDPYPQSVESENINNKSEGDVREGKAYLTAGQCYCLAGVGEKKAEPGALLVGLWPRGRRSQAARRRHAHPLGSAHAGEGVSDGASAPPFCLLDSLGCRCRCAEERGKERERPETNEARV